MDEESKAERLSKAKHRISRYIEAHPGCQLGEVAQEALGEDTDANRCKVKRRSSWKGRVGLWSRNRMVSKAEKQANKTTAEIADELARILRKEPMDLNGLAVRFGKTRGQILDALDILDNQGMNVHESNGTYAIESLPELATAAGDCLEFVSDEHNRFLFGGVADTHFGSKYERLDVIESLYDHFYGKGVKTVFHAGNMIEGECRMQSHKYDVALYGMDRQINHLVTRYPYRQGMKTYAVHGDDHEGWYGQATGIDMGSAIERAFRHNGREDWVDLGFLEADVALKNANTGVTSMLRVMHPGGGSAYALSYQPQKLVEHFEGGNKPAVTLLGHYHKMEALNYRNVWIVQVGCCQDQTPFMRKKRLAAHVGGVLLDLEQDPETGAIIECTVGMRRYFDLGYYHDRNGRWSKSGDVVQAKRGLGVRK